MFHFCFYSLEFPDFALLECVWYCGSCCGCGLKKVVLQKVLLVEVSLEKYMFG
jgi:hypothetical protein